MTLPTCPECEANKHPNCDATAWDEQADALTTCGCWTREHRLTPSLRVPYVGIGADGARRSAQIDHDEALGMDRDDPRRAEVLTSAARWEDQAAYLEACEAKPNPAKALIEKVETSYERIRQERIEAIRTWLADGKKRMLLGTADAVLLLAEIDRLTAALDRTSAALVEQTDARNRLAGEVARLNERYAEQARSFESLDAFAKAEQQHRLREENKRRAVEALAANPSAAMDLWWTTTGDDWPVPDDLPARFLQAALAVPDGAPLQDNTTRDDDTVPGVRTDEYGRLHNAHS